MKVLSCLPVRAHRGLGVIRPVRVRARCTCKAVATAQDRTSARNLPREEGASSAGEICRAVRLQRTARGRANAQRMRSSSAAAATPCLHQDSRFSKAAWTRRRDRTTWTIGDPPAPLGARAPRPWHERSSRPADVRRVRRRDFACSAPNEMLAVHRPAGCCPRLAAGTRQLATSSLLRRGMRRPLTHQGRRRLPHALRAKPGLRRCTCQINITARHGVRNLEWLERLRRCMLAPRLPTAGRSEQPAVFPAGTAHAPEATCHADPGTRTLRTASPATRREAANATPQDARRQRHDPHDLAMTRHHAPRSGRHPPGCGQPHPDASPARPPHSRPRSASDVIDALPTMK